MAGPPTRQIEAAPGELPIDRETVLAYARRSPVVAEIAEFIRQIQGITDQVDDITERYAGNLVRQLRYLGLRTIADVDEALARRKDLTEQFYVRWFPEIRVGDVSLGTPLFYLTWVLLSEAGDRDAAVDYLEAMNFAAGQGPPRRSREDVCGRISRGRGRRSGALMSGAAYPGGS